MIEFMVDYKFNLQVLCYLIWYLGIIKRFKWSKLEINESSFCIYFGGILQHVLISILYHNSTIDPVSLINSNQQVDIIDSPDILFYRNKGIFFNFHIRKTYYQEDVMHSYSRIWNNDWFIKHYILHIMWSLGFPVPIMDIDTV